MTEYILLAVMAAIVVIMLFLRTNTAIGFLALCAGTVLVSSSGVNVGLVASSITSGNGAAPQVAEGVLLLAPLVVCIFMLRGQVHKMMLPMASIPAICVAFLSVIFTVPLLSESLRGDILNTQTWDLLVQYQEPIIGIGVVTSVVMISMTVKKPHDKHKKRH